MILAEKITLLRKKNGWSQEELAEQMGVSRQSVSKWEGAQSTPDLSKLLLMSELFGVSTDYLLRDELEESGDAPSFPDVPSSPRRRVTLGDAGAYLALRRRHSGRLALGAFLCVVSPIPLLLLSALSEEPGVPLSENAAAGAGLVALLLLVAGAVALFLSCRMEARPYDYLENEPFETEYGVSGLLREEKQCLEPVYARRNTLGVIVCILSPLPLLVSSLSTERALVIIGSVSLLLLLVGVAVVLFISVGVPWASVQKLLSEGDYSPEAKRRSHQRSALSSAYWLTVTAAFLAYSFITGRWDRSWIIWAVAGVFYGALMAITRLGGESDR